MHDAGADAGHAPHWRTRFKERQNPVATRPVSLRFKVCPGKAPKFDQVTPPLPEKTELSLGANADRKAAVTHDVCDPIADEVGPAPFLLHPESEKVAIFNVTELRRPAEG